MLYKRDKSTNYIAKKQEKTGFLLDHQSFHQVQIVKLPFDRINLMVFQSLILSVVLRPLPKSKIQALLLPEPFHFSPLLLTNLPICQFVLPVVLRLPVWLAPTCVAHTVLPLFLHRYTPFSQYGLSQNFRLWQS